MTTTVNRTDIILSEESGSTYGEPNRYWTASLNGFITRDGKQGEYVSSISRTGKTHQQALTSLEAAIAENGWEIR